MYVELYGRKMTLMAQTYYLTAHQRKSMISHEKPLTIFNEIASKIFKDERPHF